MFSLHSNPEEEVLILEEEFTNCEIHGTLIEYFTDCPDCIQEENDRDNYFMSLED
ncbi:MAG: hypothetical protein ACYSW6_11720 [Planctomycetota bacterium]|jgi:hypothetical protein